MKKKWPIKVNDEGKRREKPLNEEKGLMKQK